MAQFSELASNLSHNELIELTKTSLQSRLSSDPLLSDLPQDVVLEEILSLNPNYQAQKFLLGDEMDVVEYEPLKLIFRTAAELGQSITIFVSRDVEAPLKVIVPHDISVRDLKKAIARHFELHQRRTGSKVKISWKYIWKTYSLNFDSLPLDDNTSPISAYGVTNKVMLMFKKKRKKPK